MTPLLCKTLDDTQLFVIDFEGATIPTEVVMWISFAKLLEDHGITNEQYGGINKIEGEMVGWTVEKIVDTLRKTHHFSGREDLKNNETLVKSLKEKFLLEGKQEKDFDLDLEVLKYERQQAYDDVVRDEKHNIHVHPFVEPMLKRAREHGAKVILLSNGTDSIIREVLIRDGLFDYFDLILASDSPDRKKLENEIIGHRVIKERAKQGLHYNASCVECSEEEKVIEKKIQDEVIGNKGIILAHLSKKWVVLPKFITVLEDNPLTFKKLQTALDSMWTRVLKDLVPDLGTIRKIYVRHELNWQKEEPKDAVAIFDGPAPDKLCADWFIGKLPLLTAVFGPRAQDWKKTL